MDGMPAAPAGGVRASGPRGRLLIAPMARLRALGGMGWQATAYRGGCLTLV
jgi:hypothetical protein